MAMASSFAFFNKLSGASRQSLLIPSCVEVNQMELNVLEYDQEVRWFAFRVMFFVVDAWWEHMFAVNDGGKRWKKCLCAHAIPKCVRRWSPVRLLACFFSAAWLSKAMEASQKMNINVEAYSPVGRSGHSGDIRAFAGNGGVPESLGTGWRNGTWRELDAPKKDEMLPCYVVLMFLLPVALRLEMLNLGIELGRIGELQERYASIKWVNVVTCTSLRPLSGPKVTIRSSNPLQPRTT